jgi:sugar transferase (PEP-CTERM/EpsH1 system associated)
MTSSAKRSFQLLQIAPRLPWPLDTGAKLRNFHLTRAISPDAAVALATFGNEQRISEPLHYRRVISVSRAGHNSFFNLLRGAVGKTPLPLLNYTRPQMTRALEELMATSEFDIVQFESIHLMPYLATVRAARKPALAVLDWHNIESTLLEQYGERERNPLRRAYARRTAKLMGQFEQIAGREFDAHLVVSEEDARRLRQLNDDARIFVIENGVDVAHFTENQGRSGSRRDRVVFVASMDYHANIDAAVWFARTVWPRVHQLQPALTFTIVGRDPAAEVRELTSIPGVEVTGTVEDVRPFYRDALAAIVPLRVGGGSRLKILEAMAAGVPVLATTLGAEGLAVQHGENILIANADEALREALVLLAQDSASRARLIEAGRALVKSRYDWSIVGAKLSASYQSLLSEKRPL